MTKRQKTQFQVKQDEIPRTEKSGANKGYYLFIEDDVGCLIEQRDGQTVQDTDTDQQLPTDLIERSRNLDCSFRNIYIIPSFPTREQHAHSVQNARSRFTKLNQSYSC